VRLPDFHSLNLRTDKRFFFSGSNLTVFLSIWNVYNRINIPYYIWNEMENKQEEAKLWTNGILPVFGFEYEF
jgi:hypothetical protein